MNTQKQIFVIIVLLAIFTGGCAAYAAIDLPIRADRQADFFESESIERGALLFANNCRTCHGIRGQGGVGLPLNTEEFKNQDPIVLAENRALLTTTITCGRAGTLMPAWLTENGGSLNEIQIEHLVNLITAPAEEDLLDETGSPTSEGWLSAVEFAHNLNSEATIVIGGDTLDAIAGLHGIGPSRIAEENGYAVDDVPTEGDTLILPISGEEYEVQENDSFRKISNSQHTGAMILAELNGIAYAIDEDSGAFVLTYNGSDELLMLDPKGDNRNTGLMPGTTLRFPEGATYTVIEGDTVDAIAEKRAIGADDIRALNNIPDGEEPDADTVLTLPPIDAYPVVVASLADTAAAFSAVTARSIAERNEISADAELPVGKVLRMPNDAAGSAPPNTINDGAACVEHAVTNTSLEVILGTAFEPSKPDEFTDELAIVAHANDWTFVNDGVEQTINEGLALIQTGTTVEFSNAVGLHTININGPEIVNPFNEGDTFSFTFDEPGEFVIECTFHPAMFGVVYVEDAN